MVFKGPYPTRIGSLAGIPPHAPLPRPESRDRGRPRRAAPDPAADRAGPRGDPLRGAAGARPRLRAGGRLHGRRCRRGAGGAGLLRQGHAARQRGCRAHQLPDAPSPYHAVRDVRDQVPRQAADLRRAPVDPPPHRQRQRVLGALLDPRQRVLPAQGGTARRAGDQQPPGPGRRAHRRRRRSTSWTSCARTPSAATPITRRC